MGGGLGALTTIGNYRMTLRTWTGRTL